MKKKIFLVSICAAMLLSGCNTGADLTSEQSDIIAEYAAGVLVKHAYVNKDKMAIQMTLQAEENNNAGENSQSPTQGDNSGEQGNSQQGSSDKGAVENIADKMELYPLTLECAGYTVEDTYPKEEYAMAIQADAGKKLIVVEFTIKNNTEEPVTYTKPEVNLNVKATINADTKVSVYRTMLNNDLQNITTIEIAPQASYTAILVFQADSELCESIASFSLNY